MNTRPQKIIVKNYTGDKETANRKYKQDVMKLEELGYYPISQNWTPGSYGCGAFLIALLLCFLLIGILIFIYMLIVPPAGTLTVTYELKTENIVVREVTIIEEKVCPMCAENVKKAAKICRFCGYKFAETSKIKSEDNEEIENEDDT